MTLKIFLSTLACTALIALPSVIQAQTCVTQSSMTPANRDALAATSLRIAEAFQAQDQATVKGATVPDLAASFGGVADVITSTAPLLKSAVAQVEQLYILDASSQTASVDTQFFCTLNHSMAEADFSIPQLPPGKYAFTMVRFDGPTPYRLSLLLRQTGGAGSAWQMAGLYPKPLDAAGHDGLWYWTQSRTLTTSNQPWAAWLYLQQAQILLQPAGFVSSTHLEKLNSELSAATPPAARSISPDAPLVLKAADGQEFRFSSISVDDTLSKEKIDVIAHLKVASLGDAVTARQRNLAAASALLAAHPDLRAAFHGVWIFADAPSQSPYATELAMADIK